jgi:hypothetical protein
MRCYCYGPGLGCGTGTGTNHRRHPGRGARNARDTQPVAVDVARLSRCARRAFPSLIDVRLSRHRKPEPPHGYTAGRSYTPADIYILLL